MKDDKLVLCVGMCVLDIIHTCEQYPEEDTDKRCIRGHWQRGGNASNNCTVLRHFGQKSEFLGVLSRSKAFQFLIEDCNERGIKIDNCPRVDQDPPFSSVILNTKFHTRTIIHSNSNFPILRFENFKKIDLKQYRWIHFEGRNSEETTKMIEMIIDYNKTKLNEGGHDVKDIIKISVELEKVKEELLVLTNNADYIFLGKDIALYLGWNDKKAAVYGLRERISNKSGIIICTWGSDGSAILDESDKYFEAPACPPDAILDTLGAGDTFCATTIYGLMAGRSVQDAVILANKVTGRKLAYYGYDEVGNILRDLMK